jgi:hypothetical protein
LFANVDLRGGNSRRGQKCGDADKCCAEGATQRPKI